MVNLKIFCKMNKEEEGLGLGLGFEVNRRPRAHLLGISTLATLFFIFVGFILYEFNAVTAFSSLVVGFGDRVALTCESNIGLMRRLYGDRKR